MTAAAPITEDRALSTDEVALVGWLLEHGNSDAAGFLPQIADARVVSRCPCGCASIDFAVGGSVPPTRAGMHILADYKWQAADGARFGVFVFARGGLLAGLEVWSVDGLDVASALPAVEQLQPLVFAQNVEPGDQPPARASGEQVVRREVKEPE